MSRKQEKKTNFIYIILSKMQDISPLKKKEKKINNKVKSTFVVKNVLIDTYKAIFALKNMFFLFVDFLIKSSDIYTTHIRTHLNYEILL